VSEHVCQEPVAWATLVDYWSGDLSGATLEQIEHQLFECDACGEALDAVIGLSRGISRWGGQGLSTGSTSEAVLERLTHDNLRVRRYRLDPGQTVHCTVAPDDDVVTAEFSAELARVSRVDLVVRHNFDDGARRLRIEDMSVEDGRTVRWALPAAALRPLPAHRLDIALVAVAPSGDRVVAEYVMQHSPWRE